MRTQGWAGGPALGVMTVLAADVVLAAGALLADRVLGAGGPVLAGLLPAHTAVVGALLARARSRAALALRDPVTGVFVRRVAEEYLDDASGTTLTVALLDGDDLHGINERFGHAGGDVLLAMVAERLTRACVRGDVVARLGGDEFVLISRRSAETVQQAIAKQMSAPMMLFGVVIDTRFSAGICRVPGGNHLWAFAEADRLMYAAKSRGGGIHL
ncbi:GGDEF domain-containing protein [Actinoplanes sp. HUAS TT8]|uniref:GGDEF domain-containing protein n=1 Tax=Actinoplanes sp. HUAS TT8 TaxID=3447453 RepID=UPI003F523942